MANVIKFDQAAHWYSQDGAPQHDADLRVARKSYLYPSVTTIEKQWFANPFLEQWKAEQLVQACIDNPRQPHESPQDYGQRVYEISTTKARVAAGFGKEVHDIVEHYPAYPTKDEFMPYFDLYADWHEKSIVSVVGSEAVVLDHDIGLAGRFDKLVMHRVHGLCMMDIKTQNVKKDDKGRKKPVFYESWCRQLAFYANADAKQKGGDMPTLLSVVIDSNEAGEPFDKVWTKEEAISGLEDIIFAHYGWSKRKKFWPTKVQWHPFDVLPSCKSRQVTGVSVGNNATY